MLDAVDIICRAERDAMRKNTPYYDRELDEQCGYRDALAGRPRALGGTQAGYRRGYDRGLSDYLKGRYSNESA